MISDSTYQWFAIRTKYKCEKFVVQQLKKEGIEAYVPLLHKKRQYLRKTKDVSLPLINCYVFVRISKKEYKSVLSTLYVVGFLKIGEQISAIPESEIHLMQQIVGEYHVISAQPMGWEIGDQVEVIGGNLTGLKGKLIEVKGKKELLVELKTIGFQIRMVIDERYLRTLSKQKLTNYV